VVLDHYILAFGVAGLVEAFVERAAKVRSDLGRSAPLTKPTLGIAACGARAERSFWLLCRYVC
jgi:hypothetical protein